MEVVSEIVVREQNGAMRSSFAGIVYEEGKFIHAVCNWTL